MAMRLNPFSFLRESVRFPYSRIQRSTFIMKMTDTFAVIFGRYGLGVGRNYPTVLGAPEHWGVFDYLTLGINKLLFHVLRKMFYFLMGGSSFSPSLVPGAIIFIWLPTVIIAIPLIISFGCLWLARYIVSALFTFLALPFIALIHLVVGRTLRQEAFEPNSPSPEDYRSTILFYSSDEIKELRNQALQSDKPLETLLPNSSLNQIKIGLAELREDMEIFLSHHFAYDEFKKHNYELNKFHLLIHGNHVNSKTPPPIIENISPSQASLFFRLKPGTGYSSHDSYPYAFDNGANGVYIDERPQSHIRSTDKELLSLLETAIKLNIGHITTRFEENGTLDLVLSYLKNMQEPNLIPVSVLPKEVVENLVMSYL